MKRCSVSLGKEEREEGSEAELVKKRRVEGKCSVIRFYISLLYSDLVGN